LAEYEIVEVLADGRRTLRFATGPLAGRMVVAYPASELHRLPPTPRPLPRQRTESADARAAQLLRSLLRPDQRTEWVSRHRFTVATPFGEVEFGKLLDIGFWPPTGEELRLCVVPTGAELPIADIWTNLLLALKADPRWFFTVANWRRPGGQWHLGPVPGFERRT
jgi:hypothetical protein